MRIEEVLLVMSQAPRGHDRTAPRNDPGHALRGEWDVAQQHAGMDREIVHPLLGLLDDRVAVDLPGELVGVAANLLERLVDRDSPDRNWRVAHDPLARGVDVLAGRQVHDRVRSPPRRPAHLLDLGVDAREHRRVADVRVHLHEELGADDHRLRLGVVDVGGDDGAAAGDLIADQLGRHSLADGDELHLGGDHAPARVVQLGHRRTAASPERVAACTGDGLDIAAFDDPGPAQRRQPRLGVHGHRGIAVGPAGVVETQWWIRRVPCGAAGGRLSHLPERDEQVGARALHVDPAGVAGRSGGRLGCSPFAIDHLGHVGLQLTRRPESRLLAGGALPAPALPGSGSAVGCHQQPSQPGLAELPRQRWYAPCHEAATRGFRDIFRELYFDTWMSKRMSP